jgi:hypothetical protein
VNAERAFDSNTGDLLLTLAPLMHVLRGDKRARLQRAFINVVFDMASRALDVDPSRLPPNAPTAARALHRACIELCVRAGIPRAELVADYNDHAETGGAERSPDVEDAIERCLALLSLFHARRLEAAV